MFSGVRKMTSGSSSSSSENTPLLNGSHEGPCYAYSYANSREDDDEEEEDKTDLSASNAEIKKDKLFGLLMDFKMLIIVLLIIFCTISLNFIPFNRPNWHSVAVTRGNRAYLNLSTDDATYKEVIHLRVKGPFVIQEYGSSSLAKFTLSRISLNGTFQRVLDPWIVLLSSENSENELVLEHDFPLSDHESSNNDVYQLTITTSERQDYVKFLIELTAKSKLSLVKIVLAICILVGFHILIIFELLPRVLASMTCAAVAISSLALTSQSPSLKEVINWMDIEVLSLVFGMYLLTSILCETGFFEFIAVLLYKIAGGHTWRLFTALCLMTTILSICLDSVTAIIFMTALTVRLCEAMNVDPKNIMIALVIFSNTGGSLAYSALKRSSMIGYSSFALHMLPIIPICLGIGYVLWWLRFRDITMLRFKEPLEVIDVKHEQQVWRKVYHSLSNYTREEESVKAILKKKISALETLLMKKLYDSKISTDDYKTSLKELTHTLKVKNRMLLYKSCAVFIIVFIFLLLRNIPQIHLSSGWIVVLGSICLLVLGDTEKVGCILNRVEWSALLFLASVFIIIKALVKLDLVDYMVNETINFINEIGDDNRLLVSIIIILWISSLSSTLIIPFPALMVELIRNGDEHTKPLLFALYLGASLGESGSLMGGTVNIVSTELTEQHGYKISYFDFFKIGFPFTLVTTTASMIYLLVCHIWFDWK